MNIMWCSTSGCISGFWMLGWFLVKTAFTSMPILKVGWHFCSFHSRIALAICILTWYRERYPWTSLLFVSAHISVCLHGCRKRVNNGDRSSIICSFSSTAPAADAPLCSTPVLEKTTLWARWHHPLRHLWRKCKKVQTWKVLSELEIFSEKVKR